MNDNIIKIDEETVEIQNTVIVNTVVKIEDLQNEVTAIQKHLANVITEHNILVAKLQEQIDLKTAQLSTIETL